MKGFLLGLVVAALTFGGYVYWKEKHRPSGSAAVATPEPPPPAAHERKRRRHHGAARIARSETPGGAGSGRPSGPASDGEPEPVKLSAADLKIVAQGDDLSRPDVIHLGDATDDSGSRELGQDDIDARFRAKEAAILECISRARPDEDTYVPGRITVRFRIQRTGNVRGVRVEAPAILQRGGLTGCIKGAVGSLRFPPSNGSQVVSYPFSLS
jgi:hypothetical protein